MSTRRLYWQRYIPLLVAPVAYFALRQGSVGALVGGTPAPVAPALLALDVLLAVGFYAVRSLVPVGLCGLHRTTRPAPSIWRSPAPR